MENTMTPMTSPIFPISTSGFAMPSRLRALGTVTTASAVSVIRDRQDLAAKGHVGLVAYFPGTHAWSPPIC